MQYGKGEIIKTIQWPHQESKFRVVVLLWPKSTVPVYACNEVGTGKAVGLLASKVYKPTGNYKVDLIQRVKLGCRNALREYIKVYKQYPKFLK